MNTETNENNKLWCELYKPISSKELTCGSKIIEPLREWLTNWEIRKIKTLHVLQQRPSKRKSKTEKELPKSCALIVGGAGVGKTTAVSVIADECNYQVYKPSLLGCKDVKTLIDILNNTVKSTNITNMITGINQKKIVIVIDEIESISSIPIEKKIIKALQKENDHEWHFPIIFISDEKHNKLLVEFNKSCFKIKIYPPPDFILDKILSKIIIDQKMGLDCKETSDIIIKHAQHDVRRLVNILQELYNIYGTKQITNENINNYLMMSRTKDLDTGLFDATKQLLYKYENIDTCMTLFTKAKVLLPLMIQQNYMTVILDKTKKNQLTHKDAIDTMLLVSETISKGDLAENGVYANQTWREQDFHCLYTCVKTSYYMNKLNKEEVDVNKIYINLGYTFDLNRTSIKNINKKNITNTEDCFKNINIFDYIYINRILKILLSEGKLKKCVRLLRGYNIKIEHIESLLKIDKIKKSKTKSYSLSAKQKTLLTKYLQTLV